MPTKQALSVRGMASLILSSIYAGLSEESAVLGMAVALVLMSALNFKGGLFGLFWMDRRLFLTI